jgi:hypothetical protein
MQLPCASVLQLYASYLSCAHAAALCLRVAALWPAGKLLLPCLVVAHLYSFPVPVLQLHFASDSHEPDLELYHKLKLYSEDEGDKGQQNPKKPVVTEQYEQLLFVDPYSKFYNRSECNSGS